MIDRLQYEIEISGSAATLYLAGPLDLHDVPFLRVLCAAIPSFVHMLRVDLRAIQVPSPDAVGAVREILHAWRAKRRGEFQLSVHASHLTATLYGQGPGIVPAPSDYLASHPDALMATYL